MLKEIRLSTNIIVKSGKKRIGIMQLDQGPVVLSVLRLNNRLHRHF